MQKEKFYTENQGIYTYLTYQLSAVDDIDTMSLGMITNNQINGILPVIYTQLDDEKSLKYNISAKVSVSEFFKGAVSRKRLLGVFSSIMSAIISAEEYMIDLKTLIFDLDYIFVDVSTCKAEMLCVPVIDNETQSIDLALFFKNIMFSTQFDSTENSDYVAKIMNYLNSSPNLSPTDFKVLVDDLAKGQQTVQPQMQTYQQPQTSVVMPASSQEPENVCRTSAQPVQLQSNRAQQLEPQMRPAMPQTEASMEQANAAVPELSSGKKKKSKKEKKKNVSLPEKEMRIPNMNIPGKNAVNTVKQNDEQTIQDNGKEISWLYLMQHYNKENAALYKAQKANKKSKTSKKGKNVQQSFTVPGAPTAEAAVSPQNKRIQIPGNAAPSQEMQIPGVQYQANGLSWQNASQPEAPQQNLSQQTSPKPVYTPNTLGQADANFGETVVLNQSMAGAGETTVLGAGAEAEEIIPFLIRSKNNEKIVLNKPIFRIGKEKSYVDYFIGDNTAVSRSHANIVSKDGEYFVVDTNSTNHTYVDGVMIQSNVEVKIAHGAKIRLANEDFSFNLY